MQHFDGESPWESHWKKSADVAGERNNKPNIRLNPFRTSYDNAFCDNDFRALSSIRQESSSMT